MSPAALAPETATITDRWLSCRKGLLSPPSPRPPPAFPLAPDFLMTPPVMTLGVGDGGADSGADPTPHSPPLLPCPQLHLHGSGGGGKGLLRIHGCSGAHELCTDARSIRQRPVREESKAPVAGGQLFLRGDTSFQGPPRGRR